MKIYFSLTILFSSLLALANAGDTTKVQTFTFSSTTRSGAFQFPDDTIKFEKIFMQYRLRCKGGLVSTSSNRNLGCGEWDYSCNTYITDSTKTDSVKSTAPNYVISNFSGSIYKYTTIPTYTYYQYNQKQINYTSTTSESISTLGAGTTNLPNPFDASIKESKIHYLWTASELTTAGLTAGNITGIKFDLASLGSDLNSLKIKIKTTTKTALDSASVDNSGFTEVYFLNTTFASTGLNSLNFYTPFNWNGTSNIIIELTFTNKNTGTANEIVGHDASFKSSVLSKGNDAYLNFNEVQSFDIYNSSFASIKNEISIGFWTYGDPTKLPANTSFLEAVDSNNLRTVNIHLPWSDSNIYWDCGNSGTNGYDRISKAATTTQIKGQWNYWTFIKNAATGSMKIYLNGTLWHSGTGATKTMSIKKFVLGGSPTWSSGAYWGAIDEFSVWDKELDANTIKQIMNHDINSSNSLFSNLVAYYNFNEANGTTINDASVNTSTATLKSNPIWSLIRGEKLFRNFSTLTFRPNTSFVQGVYTSTTSTITTLDSILNAPNTVESFQVTNNNLQSTGINTYWQADKYTYVYSESGTKVDSVFITATNTINISTLNYFAKWPQKFELISFVTPYGIGLDLGADGKMWQFDMSDYSPILRGKKHLNIQNGGEWQEDMDISFLFIKGTPPRNVLDVQQIWPVTAEAYTTIIAEGKFEPRTINLNSVANTFKLKSAITGHGQEGEFIARNHFLNINGGSIDYQWSVWKECAYNPVYPQGGTWVYDRAGWCPGMPTDIKEYDITSKVTPGQNTIFDYGVSTASGDSRYIVNNQLVQYGAANYSLDASISEAQQPSDRIEYARMNPICKSPKVKITNTGSTSLTSLEISYGISGTTPLVYNWAGNLAFMQSADVVLPGIPYNSAAGDFVVTIAKPNGGTDQVVSNNVLHSNFIPAPSMPKKIVIEYKTNSKPTENTYTLKNSAGTIIKARSGGTANYYYRDTIVLSDGCYELKLTDTRNDGLTWWANSSQGSGYLRIKNSSGTILKNFNSDFGAEIYQQFYYDQVTAVDDYIFTDKTIFKAFPNPSSGEIFVNIDFAQRQNATLEIIDLTGKTVFKKEMQNIISEGLNLDFSSFAKGMYIAVLKTEKEVFTQKLIME